MTDLTAQSPAEIDAQLFELLKARYAASDARDDVVDSLHHYLDRKGPVSWSNRKPRWSMNEASLLEAAYNSEDARVVKLMVRYGELGSELVSLDQQAEPLHAEFVRRGGWTRAYLVDNVDGHLHKSDHCSTLHHGIYMTRLHWITEMSGHAEAEIVELAGEKACTTCYPSAPVDVLKRASRFEGPNMAATRLDREIRAEEKRVRDAVKAAKAISNPDGSPLKGEYGTIKTEVSAWNELVGNIVDHRGWNYSLHVEVDLAIVHALAAKQGTTVADILGQAEDKVQAKARREGKGRLDVTKTESEAFRVLYADK